MANTDTNQVQLYYARETAWGETPNQSKTLQEINYVNDALDPIKEMQASEAVHTHRGRGQMPKTGLAARGGISVELSMDDWNDFFESLLMGTWVVGSAVAYTVTISGQTMTLDSGSFPAATQKARYIKIASAATSGNNGIKKVATWANGSVTLAAGSLSGSDAADAITISHKYLINANTVTSYLLERKYGNLDTAHFLYWTGMMIDSLNMALDSKSRVTANWGFVGKKPVSATATSGTGTPTAKPTTSILTTNANVGTIYENGSAITVDVKSINKTISNNLRERPVVGSDTTLQCGLGDFGVSGSLEAYFSNKAVLDRFLDHSDSIVEYALQDGTSKLLNFYLPKVKFSVGNAPSSARSTDVMQTIGFEAFADSTDRILQIDYLS